MSLKIKVLKQIGSGSYSRVCTGVSQVTGEIFALKILRNTNQGLANLMEIDIMARAKHPNIMYLLSTVFDINKTYLAMPLGQETTKADLSKLDRISLIRDLVSAVVFLHRQGIYHCDIKPANTVIVNGHLMLIDFGLSIVKMNDYLCFQSLPFSPPEYLYYRLFGMPANFKRHIDIYMQDTNNVASDYWALGTSILYFLTDKLVFNKFTETEIIDEVNVYLDNPTQYLSPTVRDIKWREALLQLMHPMASERSIEAVLNLIKYIDSGTYTKIHRSHSMNEVDIHRFNILSQWLYNVITDLRLGMPCYIGSLDMVIRYFGNIKKIEEIQLVGITALFMISKVLTENGKPIESMVWVTAGAHTKEEIKRMEMSMIIAFHGVIFPWDILQNLKTDVIKKEYMFSEFIDAYWP